MLGIQQTTHDHLIHQTIHHTSYLESNTHWRGGLGHNPLHQGSLEITFHVLNLTFWKNHFDPCLHIVIRSGTWLCQCLSIRLTAWCSSCTVVLRAAPKFIPLISWPGFVSVSVEGKIEIGIISCTQAFWNSVEILIFHTIFGQRKFGAWRARVFNLIQSVFTQLLKAAVPCTITVYVPASGAPLNSWLIHS